MTKITILGAGITGLAIASQLPRRHSITVVARDLPGDGGADNDYSLDWASPWAGAVWAGMDGAAPREQAMQLGAFAQLWRLAATHPESSVKRVEMLDLVDAKRPEEMWYFGKMPNFRVLGKEELPEGAGYGMSYTSVVLTPMTFLPWLRKQLEETGVTFKRANVESLADLSGMGHDVLVNASGWGARFLKDVADQEVQQVRGQTVLVKTDYNKLFIRRGKDYTYIFPRGDGTAVLGGIKQYGETNNLVDEVSKADILRRVHENLPDIFPKNPSEFDVVRDIVGIRPQRDIGTRVEKETINGQNVVHAYGPPGGGYTYSFGLARDAAELVSDIEYKMPKANL